MTKKHYCPLRLQMVFCFILGAACAVAIYFGVSRLGTYLIDRYYLDETATLQREQALLESFDDYVQARNLTSEDSDAIGAWAEDMKYAYILIFRSGVLTMEADATGVSQPLEDEDLWYDDQMAYDRYFYPVHFQDGVCAVTVYDFSSARMYTISNVASITLAAIGFLAVILLNNRRLRKRITDISHCVYKVAAGDLELKITESGRDELSDLAMDIDQMRRTLLDQLKKEQEAWQANTDLLRAISHDIRTPMTALLGYLDLVQSHQYETKAQLEQYLAICDAKAQQLRQLTDKLFGYFLVFANRELHLKQEPLDTQLLFTQLFGEEICCLENEGFTVTWERLEQGQTVVTDAVQLQRVVANLFSNIRKYADPAKPVQVQEQLRKGRICVRLSNAVNPVAGAVESNQIGLRTSRKLMQLLGGGLHTSEAKGVFLAELTLPVQPQPEPATEA